MKIRQPNIGELVLYLDEKHPAILDKLKLENPDFVNIIIPDQELGLEEFKEGELKARAAVCLATIAVVLKDGDTKLTELKNRLQSSASWELAGKVIAAVSSAGVVTSLLAHFVTASFITGLLSFVANMILLIVNAKNKLLVSDKKIDKVFIDLLNFKTKLESYQTDLDFFVGHNFSVSGISKTVNNCNLLISEFKKEISLV